MSEFIRSLKADRVIQRRLRNDIEIDVHYSEAAGLAWLEGVPGSALDVEAFYQQRYAELYYTEKEKSDLDSNFRHFLPMQQKRVAAIAPYLRPEDTLLEIGCGPGYFLSAVKAQCRAARGIELNTKEAEYARREHALDVRAVPLNTLEDERYEHICLFQVLEHQPDPVDFLLEIKRLARRERCHVHVEVPALNNALISLYNVPAFRNFWFQKPHLFYFTRQGLERVCREAGLAVQAVSLDQETSLFNHFHWMLNGTPMKHRKLAVEATFPPECLDRDDPRKAPILSQIQALMERANREYRALLEGAGFGDILFCTAAPEQ